MQIPFFISGVQKVKNALVDSGAMDNFLTLLLMKRMGLQICKLRVLKPILTVDGSEHKQGKLMEYTDLVLRLGEQQRKQRFYIATLGHDRAILGFPFLSKFNPNIDWAKNEIVGHRGVQIEPEQEPQEDILIQILLLQNKARKQCGEPGEGEELHYIIQKVSFVQQWAAAADKPEERMTTTQIPLKYQKHWKVFDEEHAKRFPLSQTENMCINLIPDASEELDCKIYPLNQQELETLRKYLAEELAKGFIEDGSSPYTSPTFYILKKDKGEYRLVVDYHKLNDITIKDHYPMPNVQTELDKLKGKHLFTKFDVRAGYNNIQIQPEDAYKAAFKTPLGTYVLKVMPFGLTNAPSVFQCAMYRDMHPLLLKYPEYIANLMDNWVIVTMNTPKGQALHEEIVHAFLEQLETHSYFLKASKCIFAKDYVNFLGFQICAGCA
jgi:hypothetical protein